MNSNNMNMIDWHMPSEIQSKGISLARNTETIIPFIQPLTPKHNKKYYYEQDTFKNNSFNKN